jgi:hypothetical protein
MSNKFYCGDRDEIPDKYSRRGSRLECIRRGVGVGMYLKEKELGINKVPVIYDENEEEREERLTREEKRGEHGYVNKDEYKQFMEDNFDKAKRDARNLEIGDIFKQLAIMWKLEKKMKRKNQIDDDDE